MVDPLNHYGTEQEQAAVPDYPPHPITEEIALTVFPGARPIKLLGPIRGLTAAELRLRHHRLVQCRQDRAMQSPISHLCSIRVEPIPRLRA